MNTLLFFVAITAFQSAIAIPLKRDPGIRNDSSFCWQGADTTFVFGDSYSAIAGEKGSSSTWSLFESADAVTNNPIVLNGTTGSGPNWVEYLTGCVQGRPQDCSPQLFNLAYNGATVNSSLAPPWRPIIADFIKQVDLWNEHVLPSVQWTRAISLVWFGINDVIITRNVSNAEIGDLFTRDLEDYFEQMENIYQQEIRHFVIINVPPVDRTPEHTPHKDVLVGRIAKYNTMLHDRVEQFRTQHTDTTLIEIDAHRLFSSYLDNPSQLGIQDTTNSYKRAGGNGLSIEQYFWNDDLHPTYVVHQAFGRDIQSELEHASVC